jgi:hypothetical protein
MIRTAGVNYVPIFCMNCGRPGGLVSERGVNFVGWMCDACQEKYPLLPGTYAVPDTAFQRQVEAEMVEKHGRILTAQEITEALKDERSSLARLAKDRPVFGKN